MFIVFSIISAVFVAGKRMIEKKLTNSFDPLSLGWISLAASLPFLALFLLNGHWINIFTLSGSFWYPLLVIWIVLWPLQTHCYYRALKEGQMSEVLPLLALVPVFTVIISSIFIHEVPTILSLIGVLVIVLAIYTGMLQPKQSILLPIKHLFKHVPSLLMFTTSLSMSIGGVLDKVAISASNPYLYGFINVLGGMFVMLSITLVNGAKNKKAIGKNIGYILLIGLVQAIGYTARNLALSSGFVAYAVAIISSNILLASIFGAIVFKEKLTANKISSFALIIVGFIILAIGQS